tara:strand:+ start:540 stop:734 length:195 start_codon:yes stop_codon:yes gene_type:complete
MENKVIKLMREMGIVLQACEMEAEKFCAGNKSAGTRLRKHMQTVKEHAQHVRKEVQEQKNSVLA